MDEIDKEETINRILELEKTSPDARKAALFQAVIDLIKEIRTIRGQNHVSARDVVDVTLDIPDKDELRTVYEYKAFIERMTKCRLYFTNTE